MKMSQIEVDQHNDNILPDTFGSEEIIKKHGINNLSIHELRDVLSSQNLTNQSFLFEGKIDLDRKLVGTIMPLEILKRLKSI